MAKPTSSRSLFVWALVLAGLAGPVPGLATEGDDGRRLELPLVFEPNLGQSGDDVRFLACGKFASFAFRPLGVQFHLRAGNHSRTGTVDMSFVDGNPLARIVPRDRRVGKSHYFLGSDPKRWVADVPQFGRVAFEDVYPGIDVAFFGVEQRLRFDILVGPGADPRKIRLRFDGAGTVAVAESGALLVDSTAGKMTLLPPRVYQEVNGDHVPIQSGYAVLDGQQVGFRIGAYDTGLPLVVDPTVEFASYFGGSQNELAFGVAIDAQDRIVVAGSTDSSNLPLVQPLQGSKRGGLDAFIAKFSADGTQLLHSTYFGGSLNDEARGIALDKAGNIYVTGNTSSLDFPVLGGVQPQKGDRSFNLTDVFALKLSPDGSSLEYSTYLGGSHNESAIAIDVDDGGNAYVTGTTSSGDYPTANAFQSVKHGSFFSTDVFLTKLPPSGASLVYSTFIGGSIGETAKDVFVDAQGRAWLTGDTGSFDFPTVNPLQTDMLSTDAYLTRFAVDGMSLEYSTYLGGNGIDGGGSVAIDGAGNIYVAGFTLSTDLPTINPFQALPGGNLDAFVMALDPQGSSIRFSTYLGGSGADRTRSVLVDSAGITYVTGSTQHDDFPVLDATQSCHPSTFEEGFITAFDPTGAPIYSTCIGGDKDDVVFGAALDSTRALLVVGQTRSADFPTVAPFQGELSGQRDAFLAKIEAPTVQNTPPVADAGTDDVNECSSPAGADVTLDGSGSSDLDSTPGTNDDIVLFEWFEDFGLPSEIFLGEGETLNVTLYLGGHSVTLRVTDRAGASDTDTAVKTVVDTTPPTIGMILEPGELWPPNHRMVQVAAFVNATDACGTPDVKLASVSSSEPDNAPGRGDGNTLNDVQDAVVETADFAFLLRAERSGSGAGRTYTAEYTATDSAGLVAAAADVVLVPHSRGGKTDALDDVTVDENQSGTVLSWTTVEGAQYYNVIRGDLTSFTEATDWFDLGSVRCIEATSVDEDTQQWEDPQVPGPGKGFFYLVEYFDGSRTAYGSESSAKPRIAGSGDCL